MRDMRNVAAEKTMPLRLDPDPARACPAPIRGRRERSNRQRMRKKTRREDTETVVADFLGEESKLSPAAGLSAAQQETESRNRRKSAAPEDPPTIVRNPQMRRRRVKLAEAMREIGLDEAAVAETLMEILTRRRKPATDKSQDIARDKFLLDLVKESVRILDGTKSGADETEEEAPTIFRLTHHIPRPVREE